jgi:hypothetical protein
MPSCVGWALRILKTSRGAGWNWPPPSSGLATYDLPAFSTTAYGVYTVCSRVLKVPVRAGPYVRRGRKDLRDLPHCVGALSGREVVPGDHAAGEVRVVCELLGLEVYLAVPVSARPDLPATLEARMRMRDASSAIQERTPCDAGPVADDQHAFVNAPLHFQDAPLVFPRLAVKVPLAGMLQSGECGRAGALDTDHDAAGAGFRQRGSCVDDVVSCLQARPGFIDEDVQCPKEDTTQDPSRWLPAGCAGAAGASRVGGPFA